MTLSAPPEQPLRTPFHRPRVAAVKDVARIAGIFMVITSSRRCGCMTSAELRACERST